MKRTLVLIALLCAAAVNVGAARFADPGACVTDDAGWSSTEGGCKDLATGRVWSRQPEGNWHFDSAVSYCDNLVEGDQSDWRMPTIAELQSAVANGAYTHLALTQSANGWPGHNWSSTAAKPRTDYYAIRFSDGQVVIRGTKPGSKNGNWLLALACTR